MPDRILVADDEADILNIVKSILERRKYQVLTVGDGEECLRKADAEIPDLILLDLVMPGKSGLEVCRILKNQAKTKHIPVVMFTALGRDVDRKLAQEAGSDSHFTKPFTHEALLAEVKANLEKVRASKFSKQLGLQHENLKGKRILLEFDPSTPYERLLRDFALECVAHNEATVILTRGGSVLHHAVEGEEGVEVMDLAAQTMMSSILEEHPDEPLSLIYDSLSDLILTVGAQAAYASTQNMLRLLSDARMTALFVLNSSAHESKDIYSLKGLFSTQVDYGKQGIASIRTA